MWPAKRAGWACKPRIAALRASSGLRPTVRYSVGSPGKRKRHRGWFPERSATVQYSVGSPGKRKRHRGRFPDRGATVQYPIGSPGKRKRHRGRFPDRSVTVQYPIGSPGKRKRHRGWFPDRGATHLIRVTNTTAPAGLPLIAHLQNRGDVTRRHPQVGGGIGQRFIQGTDGI